MSLPNTETKAERVERIKKEKNPLSVLDDVKRLLKEGQPLDDETVERLKWYGVYAQKQQKDESEKYYMLRVKLVAGEVTPAQLELIGNLSKKYAANTADFTTRSDIQLHHIKEADIVDILNELGEFSLSTKMACGDCPRTIVTCPVDGIDPDEIVSVSDTVRELDFVLSQNEDFANLPRKFKISVGGCSKHCPNHEIQDLGFTAFKVGERVLFDITAGGGLGNGKRIAHRLGKACEIEDIKKVSVAVIKIFKEHGNRGERTKARLRHLIEKIGEAEFLGLLEGELGFRLEDNPTEPKITKLAHREHFGIHPSKQSGKTFIGFATGGGKASGDRLITLAGLMFAHDVEKLRFTVNQNFVAIGVDEEKAKEFAVEVARIGFEYTPSAFSANTLTCTGLTYCRLAVSETKDFGRELTGYLESKFSFFNIPLTIAISGCQNGCSHPYIADIGLIGTMVKVANNTFERGFEVELGGKLEGTDSKFTVKTGLKLPPQRVKKFVEFLIKSFEESDYEDFNEFVAENGMRTAVEFGQYMSIYI